MEKEASAFSSKKIEKEWQTFLQRKFSINQLIFKMIRLIKSHWINWSRRGSSQPKKAWKWDSSLELKTSCFQNQMFKMNKRASTTWIGCLWSSLKKREHSKKTAISLTTNFPQKHLFSPTPSHSPLHLTKSLPKRKSQRVVREKYINYLALNKITESLASEPKGRGRSQWIILLSRKNLSRKALIKKTNASPQTSLVSLAHRWSSWTRASKQCWGPSENASSSYFKRIQCQKTFTGGLWTRGWKEVGTSSKACSRRLHYPIKKWRNPRSALWFSSCTISLGRARPRHASPCCSRSWARRGSAATSSYSIRTIDVASQSSSRTPS